jgi:hypothetical protein
MLVIGAGDTFSGVAGTASVITVTATGVSVDATTGAETLSKLYQGQLPSSVATLFTVTAGKSYVIKTISVTNSGSAAVSGVQLFLSGTASANSLVGPITLQGYSTTTFSENGWSTTDANGQILVVSTTGGITQLTGDVTAGPGSGSQIATVVHAPASGITGTTLASNVVSSSLTSVGTLASGVVPTSLLTGTLAAAQEPAHTGDMTNTAGSLVTSVVKVNGAVVPTSAKALASNASNQLIAATLSGTGTGLTTGPTTSVSGDVVTFTGVVGQVADSGTLLTALAPKASPTFTGSVTLPLTTAGLVTTTAGGVIGSESTATIGQGGTGTGSTLTGLVRGSASAMTAAELSGDVTTSGSNVATVVKVNGGSVPASQPILASNVSNQIVAATTTGSGTTAVLSTSPTFVTAVTSPVVYGGSAAGSTLTLDGTSNGAPSNAYVLINPSGQGNVGIGATNPLATLHVISSSVGGVPSLISDSMETVNFQSGTTVQLVQGGISTPPYSYWLQTKQSTNSGASFPLSINPLGGNVGIGTTAPHSKLAVVGLPVFLTNALAIAGGLAAGDFYRTGADPDLVAVVH